MTNRVSFLIDGFNLYHSICSAMADHKLARGKWLDIWRLCESFLNVFGKDAIINKVYYFSALAKHISDAGAPLRHQVFIEALESTGVQTIMGKFKKKRIKCRATCQQEGWGYEEKETDVNIAIKLMELMMTDACDTAVIVSGDTDLATALRAAKRLFPSKKLGVGFPYKRGHGELEQLADCTFKIKAEHYSRFVFPDKITLSNGTTIQKPANW